MLLHIDWESRENAGETAKSICANRSLDEPCSVVVPIGCGVEQEHVGARSGARTRARTDRVLQVTLRFSLLVSSISRRTLNLDPSSCHTSHSCTRIPEHGISANVSEHELLCTHTTSLRPYGLRPTAEKNAKVATSIVPHMPPSRSCSHAHHEIMCSPLSHGEIRISLLTYHGMKLEKESTCQACMSRAWWGMDVTWSVCGGLAAVDGEVLQLASPKRAGRQPPAARTRAKFGGSAH